MSMAAVKAVQRTKAASRRKTVSKPITRNRFFDYFRFGESYTSLILGIVVVIIASILLLSFAKNKNIVNTNPPIQDTSSTKTQAPEAAQKQTDNSYTVQAGDSLWTIAEKQYKDGYKWTEIAKANNLINPGSIEVGSALELPKIEKAEQTITDVPQDIEVAQENSGTIRSPTSQPTTVGQVNKIVGNTYSVVRGDYLWEIAIRAYGDGYQWVKIANANKLENPDLIHSGNKLSIPR